MIDFKNGVSDAEFDLVEGWLPKKFSLDFIVNELRVTCGASDSYVAGYLSVIYGVK
jgi:hypothetical protein